MTTSNPMHEAVTALGKEKLPVTFKGLPSTCIGDSLSSIGAQPINLLKGDVPMPVAVINEARLEHNITWMSKFAAHHGISLCPHGKTTMAPQIFQRQLDAGAWGITAATACHVRTYRQFGVSRIVLANQLTGTANINMVVDELISDPTFDFYCLIDSTDNLDELLKVLHIRAPRRPLQVLLELGTPGGRTGVRDRATLDTIVESILAAAPLVSLRGVETYEGIITRTSMEETELAVKGLLKKLVAVTQEGLESNWFGDGDVLVTAGGTSFFDLVTDALSEFVSHSRVRPILRSGCYVTHDSLHFAKEQIRMRERSGTMIGPDEGLKNALEVWACVQSVPESHRAICTLGKRDISHDMSLPAPLWWFRPGEHTLPQAVPEDLRVVALNDQHAYIDADNAIPWQAGDLVGFGIAHPCTTFDKWPLMLMVDDDYSVVGGIRTFF